MRLLPLGLLLALGCRPEGVTKYKPADAGNDTDTAATSDTGEPDDSGEPDDTSDTSDTSEPDDTADTADISIDCIAEVCDGVDNDCDGAIDEEDAVDAGIWYADGDADGFGAGAPTVACTPPEGAAENADDCDDADPTVHPGAEVGCTAGDANCDGAADDVDADGDGFLGCEECDDTDATAFPGAPEECDGADDDCNGAVDDDPIDPATWYADDDADGFGGDTSTDACDAPFGAVSTSDDCDDANAAVFPGAAEVCNAIDDDCDGTADDGAVDRATWYIDDDGDGYGDAATTSVRCDAPTGYVANADDCDDADGLVHPAGIELCNLTDDDCDGTIDEDDAADVTTWYEDADLDTWGNSDVAVDQCDAPVGYVELDGDCDDTDDAVFPGSTESFDGVDNDCDGTVDRFDWSGTGADGALSVTGTTTIGEAWPVTAITGPVVTLNDLSTLAEGDEVLIINMHGSDAAHTHVGVYEFGTVSSVSGTEVTLSAPLASTFGEASNADLSGQAIQVVRVPNYTDVAIDAGGLLTAPPWDGETGGIVAFRASGTLSIADGGAVSADDLGYAAGATGTSSNYDAFQGESYAGTGDGNLTYSYTSGAYGNWAAGYYLSNYGGGGAMITGGGGNYGGRATAGDSWNGGSYPEAAAGETYGDAALTMIFPGSGGAGVWYGNTVPGPGGDGAGIVWIAAGAIAVAGADGVTAVGATTTNWSTGTWTYGAGGGAGGSIWLTADTVTLVTDSVEAGGGFGEAAHTRDGGDGGVGRVRLDYNQLNGATYGSGADATAATDGSEPDPGWTAVP